MYAGKLDIFETWHDRAVRTGQQSVLESAIPFCIGKTRTKRTYLYPKKEGSVWCLAVTYLRFVGCRMWSELAQKRGRQHQRTTPMVVRSRVRRPPWVLGRQMTDIFVGQNLQSCISRTRPLFPFHSRSFIDILLLWHLCNHHARSRSLGSIMCRIRYIRRRHSLLPSMYHVGRRFSTRHGSRPSVMESKTPSPPRHHRCLIQPNLPRR